MAYINYARRPSTVKTFTKDIDAVPWEDFYNVYTSAANEWEELALASHRASHEASYEHMIRSKELALDSESGAYEGNIRDEFPIQPITPLPNKGTGRRKAGQKALALAVEGLNFGDWALSIMPQIITKVGNLPVTHNDNGLISGKAFVLDNFKTPADRGMYLLLMIDSRSCYLGVQYKAPTKQYSALVPLIMYAQRLIKGTDYLQWDPAELRSVVNNDLADAMLFTAEDWPTNEELILGREQGLRIASGKQLGKSRSPVSTHRLFATTGTCYQGIPPLAQVMLAQIWVAHPDNRTKYMVLDPKQWNKVPAALVTQEPFDEPTFSTTSAPDVPW